MTKCEGESNASTSRRMRVRTSTTAYHSVSGKRERLPYNGISDRRSCLTPYSMLHAPYSILNAQCSMLNAQCSVLCALCFGAVSTSVTLLGQNIGNTVLIIGYTFSVSFEVFFGRISAREKFLVPKSTWPSRRRPNQTSIKSSAIGLSPTDQPPRLALRKSG